MFIRSADKRLFFCAVCFTFGGMCGAVTGRCVSSDCCRLFLEQLSDRLASSAPWGYLLLALTVPIFLTGLGVSLWGTVLILPVMIAHGTAFGWLLCCLFRCGTLQWWLPAAAGFLPQIPCTVQLGAVSMRLSSALRRLASGGYCRPDLREERKQAALCCVLLCMTALLQTWCLDTFLY